VILLLNEAMYIVVCSYSSYFWVWTCKLIHGTLNLVKSVSENSSSPHGCKLRSVGKEGDDKFVNTLSN
jgi:hypothetical protein